MVAVPPPVSRPAVFRDAGDAARVFSCRRCGECCDGRGGIVLRRGDSERLAAHLAMALPDFYARFTEVVRGKRRLAGNGNGGCVFSGGTGCSVHGAKPDICRAWPFFRGNLTDPGSLAMAKQGCPGIRKDALFADFARAGARHLLARGICLPPDEAACPAALMPEEFLRRIAGEDAGGEEVQ